MELTDKIITADCSTDGEIDINKYKSAIRLMFKDLVRSSNFPDKNAKLLSLYLPGDETLDQITFNLLNVYKQTFRGTIITDVISTSWHDFELSKSKNKVYAGLSHLPFPDNTFDLAYAQGISQEFEEVDCFLEVYRVIKPGGLLVFTDLSNFGSPMPLTKSFVARLNDEEIGFRNHWPLLDIRFKDHLYLSMYAIQK